MERDSKAMERMREEAAKEHKKHKKMGIAMVRVAGLLTSAAAKRRGT